MSIKHPSLLSYPLVIPVEDRRLDLLKVLRTRGVWKSKRRSSQGIWNTKDSHYQANLKKVRTLESRFRYSVGYAAMTWAMWIVRVPLIKNEQMIIPKLRMRFSPSKGCYLHPNLLYHHFLKTKDAPLFIILYLLMSTTHSLKLIASSHLEIGRNPKWGKVNPKAVSFREGHVFIQGGSCFYFDMFFRYPLVQGLFFKFPQTTAGSVPTSFNIEIEYTIDSLYITS